MDKVRMETFSDAVIAIIMTILVLELTIPQTADLNGLLQLKEQFLAYGLSFFILAVYWVNHHHLLHLVDRGINTQILWANFLSLFPITFVPYVTAWLGRTNFDSLVPAMLYGFIFLIITITVAILKHLIIKSNGKGSKIHYTLSGDHRSLISIIVHTIAILLAFISPILTPITIFLMSTVWIIPSKTIKSKTIKKIFNR